MKAAMAEIYNLWSTNRSDKIVILIKEGTYNLLEKGFFWAI